MCQAGKINKEFRRECGFAILDRLIRKSLIEKVHLRRSPKKEKREPRVYRRRSIP